MKRAKRERARKSRLVSAPLSSVFMEIEMREEDDVMLKAIEDAIRGGLKSRQEIAMAVGLTVPRFNRIASMGVAAGRLRTLQERDRWKGLQFALGASA